MHWMPWRRRYVHADWITALRTVRGIPGYEIKYPLPIRRHRVTGYAIKHPACNKYRVGNGIGVDSEDDDQLISAGDADRNNLWHGSRDQVVQMTDELVMCSLRNPYDPFLTSGNPVPHAN
jgi:hypothetical protein